MNDPFASAPAESQPDPQAGAYDYSDGPPVEHPEKKALGAIKVDVKPNILPPTEGKHVVTLKGGTGFDAPWYVIHASGLDELEQLFSNDASRLVALFERIQKAGSHFSGLGVFNGGAPTRQERQAPPQGAQEPPAGAPPSPGPGWVYKSGKKKNGSGTWQAWMPPQGSDEKPVWF